MLSMKSGRYIGVMSGTSLDGVDVVLAAIDERMVAQQASYSHPIPLALKNAVLGMCQGQQVTLEQVGALDTQLGILFGAGVAEKRGYFTGGSDGDRLPRSDGLASAKRRHHIFDAAR